MIFEEECGINDNFYVVCEQESQLFYAMLLFKSRDAIERAIESGFACFQVVDDEIYSSSEVGGNMVVLAEL